LSISRFQRGEQGAEFVFDLGFIGQGAGDLGSEVLGRDERSTGS
jgi:hypothetical protein